MQQTGLSGVMVQHTDMLQGDLRLYIINVLELCHDQAIDLRLQGIIQWDLWVKQGYP